MLLIESYRNSSNICPTIQIAVSLKCHRLGFHRVVPWQNKMKEQMLN